MHGAPQSGQISFTRQMYLELFIGYMLGVLCAVIMMTVCHFPSFNLTFSLIVVLGTPTALTLHVYLVVIYYNIRFPQLYL